jgi:hypothetical protein
VTPGRSRLAVAVSSQYLDLRPDWSLLRRALTDLGLVVSTVPLDDGTPAVLELELLDPALFFGVHPRAATRFAHVLARLIKEAPTAPGG